MRFRVFDSLDAFVRVAVNCVTRDRHETDNDVNETLYLLDKHRV